jgi:hypothetical protein
MKFCSVEGYENNSSCENISLCSFPETKKRDEWIKFAKKGTWLPKLKGQCHEIFDLWFFHQSITPRPQMNTLEYFRILF